MRGEWTRKKIQKGYRRLRPPPPPPDPRHKGFDSACYAPSTSMYFDQFGNVRACCQNTDFLMGNIREQTIREIWDSTATARLRSSLSVGDYSLGCGFCQWQVDQGDDEMLFARVFEGLPATNPRPEWPVQMEFSMTNSCNLQCVMCNGDWSSSIRSHREHRPPIPNVYDDRFFAELVEFLPHLQKVNVLGGEPFLGAESLRVLSMFAEMDAPPEVVVTTNGTQWTPRVEAICESLPMSFVVSLDGITKETYEAIRVGANFDEVMRNFDRLHAYTRRNGTTMSIAHCFMRPNFRELARLLTFAEERDLFVGFNEVLFPSELSLFQLGVSELRDVVEVLRADPLASGLSRLRPMWDAQVAALEHRLHALDGGIGVTIRPWSDGDDTRSNWSDHATKVLTDWVGTQQPIRFELGRGHPKDSPQSAFASMIGLDSVCEVEEFLDHLTRFVGTDLPRINNSDVLLHDVIVSDECTPGGTEFRVSWNLTPDGTTMLVAVRNPPPPLSVPEDPVAALRSDHGADRVLMMSTDSTRTVVDASGASWILGTSDPSDLIGKTEDELYEHIQLDWSPIRLEPGPSGYQADTWIRGIDSGGQPKCIRVMTKQADRGRDIYLAAP